MMSVQDQLLMEVDLWC